jgi:crossover junction endodeoxyribonuclease RusA
MVLSKKAREYKWEVKSAIGIKPVGGVFPLRGPLNVQIQIYPPDKRRRDIDNCAKAILDALGSSGLYEDDSQIDYLALERKPYEKGSAFVLVMVSKIV